MTLDGILSSITDWLQLSRARGKLSAINKGSDKDKETKKMSQYTGVSDKVHYAALLSADKKHWGHA